MLRNVCLASAAYFGLLACGATPAMSQPPVFPMTPGTPIIPGTPVFPGAPGGVVPIIVGFQVQYRQPFWRERRFFSPFEAQEFANRKSSQGFEVLIARHHSHRFEVRYRMPFWHTFQTTPSFGEAALIQRDLLSRGYQVRIVQG
jgi:hypothetical protein